MLGLIVFPWVERAWSEFRTVVACCPGDGARVHDSSCDKTNQAIQIIWLMIFLFAGGESFAEVSEATALVCVAQTRELLPCDIGRQLQQ